MPEPNDSVAKIVEHFPRLAEMTEAAKERLATGQTIQAKEGTFLFGVGNVCNNFIFLLDGSVRVYVSSEAGREMSLYRIEPGKTCLLTTSCLVGRSNYPAIGRAETDVTGFAICNGLFNELLVQSPAFRELVFEDFGSRLAFMIQLMQEVAFRKLDLRLGQFLLGHDLSKITHQDIALELGTVREMISRLLKQFQHEGLVRLHRNRIEIPNRIALKKRCT